MHHGFQSITFMDLVLFMYMRAAFWRLPAHLRVLAAFFRSAHRIDALLADATTEQLRAKNEPCVICLEPMVTAKVLRCGHLFHRGCLRMWLERHATCPHCRRAVPLNEPRPARRYRDDAGGDGHAAVAARQHRRAGAAGLPVVATLHEIFPQIPESVIARDLMRTGSVEITTANILDGRLDVLGGAPVAVAAASDA